MEHFNTREALESEIRAGRVVPLGYVRVPALKGGWVETDLAVFAHRIPDGKHRDEAGEIRLVVRTMSWEAYVHLAFDEIRLAGAGSPQVTRRLKAALMDLRSVAPPERVEVLDLQLDLLSKSAEASLADERDVALALFEDREGIGAAASSIDGTALRSS